MEKLANFNSERDIYSVQAESPGTNVRRLSTMRRKQEYTIEEEDNSDD